MKTMIYALIASDDNLNENPGLTDIKGISGGRLEIITAGKIGAVVCKIHETDLVADKNKAIDFAYVIDKLTLIFNLLPARFGSVMESAEAISTMLERNSFQIHQNLLKVKNKSEFGIKVMCDAVALKLEIATKSSPGLILSENTEMNESSSVFRNYVDKKLKEHRIEEMILVYVDEVISKITITLEGLDASFKFKKMVSEKTIIDAIFLLDKEMKNEIIQAVTGFQNQYPALNFILTGPWPPYNFVELNLK